MEYTKVIDTTSGQIRGFYEEEGIMCFKGVPYAEPPVGEKRWKRAEPYAHRDGVRDCTEFGPSCYQNKLDEISSRIWTTEFVIQNRNYSEDCLTLNLWTNENKKDMPVVLYFYGGGFVSGGSSCEIYNGVPYAKKGVIYVTFTHREGAFAWFANEKLSSESEESISGNYMLSDAEAALIWIRDNIEKFGGDPKNVTIWGQSSGASEVNLFQISKRMAPYFNKVISMGLNNFPIIYSLPWVTKEGAYEQGRPLYEAGDGSLEKLREMPAEEFCKHTYIKSPMVDHYYVDDLFRNEIIKGVNPDITVMMGMVAGDYLMVPLFLPLRGAQNMDEFRNTISRFYPETCDEIIEEYHKEDAPFVQSAVAISTDIMYYGLLEYAGTRNKVGKGETYIYVFKHVMPGPDQEMFGAFHSSEVPYFNDHLSDHRKEWWKPEDHALAKKMNELMTGFLKEGKPAIDGFIPSDGTNMFVITADSQENTVIEPEKIERWKHLFG
ncbi:MAG: carboxylesterase family protein [Lachnospiraceae bacterium]|nr:carboxylesterase family protein [Lachnospiraceae bacterium]